jgi:phage terminase large subunit-like protein
MALAAGPKTGASPLDLDDLPEDPQDRAMEFLAKAGVHPYLWQERVLRDLVPGQERPRVAYGQLARKNGKTTVAAMEALVELCLYPGRHIYAVSDSERNLHSVLWLELVTMINRSEYLRKGIYVFKNKLENPFNGSFLELRPGNFQASQGINPHLVLADEVHLMKPEVWHGYTMSMAAREDPLLLGITTPGYSLTGIAYDTYTEIKAGESDVYSIIYEPSNPGCAIDDREAWEEANPAICEVPGLLRSLEYDVTHLPEHEFRRFRLGQWTAVEESWLPYGAFQACGTDRELQPGEECFLGFDGSWSGDSTGLVACTRDGHLQVLGHWFKPNLSAEWRVPISDVEEAIRLACRTLTVREIAADPARWSRSLQALANEGLPVVEYPQSPARMIPSTARFYDAVLDRKLTYCKKRPHGKALEVHIANARVKESAAGIMVRKEHKDSPAKIDLAVCAILSHDRATRARNRAPIEVDWF